MSAPVRVVVTMSGGRLAAALERLGAEVVCMPAIRIAPPEDWADADRALLAWRDFAWAAFTSANAVRMVWERFEALRPIGASAAGGPRIAAVGRATADALRATGFSVDLVPPEHAGVTLAGEIARRTSLAGSRVFFPRGDRARGELPDALRKAGAEVAEAIVYRTLPARIDGDRARDVLGSAGAVAFASPSAAESIARAVGTDFWREMGLRIASIGPTTSAALRKLGRPPDIEAGEADSDALAAAIVRAAKEIRS